MKIRHKQQRPGNILVLSAALMVFMMGVLAFAVDLGYFQVVRTEMQRSADAAALAAAWQLIYEEDPMGSYPDTRATAEKYVALNVVAQNAVTLADADVRIGTYVDPSDPEEQMSTTFNPALINGAYNAVEVRVQRNAGQNGEVGFFFARAMGNDTFANAAVATAAFLKNIRGFRPPADPENPNLGVLPMALDEQTWIDLMNGNVSDDDWKWDPVSENVVSGSDQKFEVNLFPQGTGSPGNRGTVDIGKANNSTADISRQITEGVSPQDLAHIGGTLELDPVTGELILNGDTGISAGVKDELESIVGATRIIPIFRTVVGPGNNAQYTIVKWVGVRIMEVELTGPMNQKRVMVQPAKVVTRGAIPAEPDPNEQSSTYVYSYPWIVLPDRLRGEDNSPGAWRGN